MRTANIDLKQLRETAGLSQTELARRVSLDQSTISRLEEKPEQMSLDVFLRICRAVGVQPEHAVQGASPEHGLHFWCDTSAYADLDNKAGQIRESAATDADQSTDRDLPGLKDIGFLADSITRRPSLVVTGPFDSGKSTFINLLLGSDSVPVQYSPTTNVVTYLHHSDEKPQWCAPVVVLGRGFEPERWRDESHVMENAMLSGDLELLKRLHHGGEQIDDASFALAYLPAPVLKVCTIVDTPGDNHDDRDSMRTLDALQHRNADVLVHMAPLVGFLGGAGVTRLDSHMETVADLGSACDISRNLYIVMSHASPAQITDDGVATVFDSAARRVRLHGERNLTDSPTPTERRKQDLGDRARGRMFTFYEGIGNHGPLAASRGQELLDDLSDLLSVELPAVAHERASNVIHEYCNASITTLHRERQQLDALEEEIVEASTDRMRDLRAQVELGESYIQEFMKQVSVDVDVHHEITAKSLQRTLDRELAPTVIEEEIRSRYSKEAMEARSEEDRKKGPKKLAQSEMPAIVAKAIQDAVEHDLLEESKEFAKGLDNSLQDLRSKFRRFEWLGKGEIPFDLDGAFIGGAMSSTAVGALALWASTLGNLGAYIIAAHAAGWLATLGISLPAGGATLVGGMAAMGGPIGVAVAIVAIGAIIGMQFRDSWQARLASNIAKTLRREQVKVDGEQRDGLPILIAAAIEDYWHDTEKAVRNGAEEMQARLRDQLELWEDLTSANAAERRETRRARIDNTLKWVTWLDSMVRSTSPKLG